MTPRKVRIGKKPKTWNPRAPLMGSNGKPLMAEPAWPKGTPKPTPTGRAAEIAFGCSGAGFLPRYLR